MRSLLKIFALISFQLISHLIGTRRCHHVPFCECKCLIALMMAFLFIMMIFSKSHSCLLIIHYIHLERYKRFNWLILEVIELYRVFFPFVIIMVNGFTVDYMIKHLEHLFRLFLCLPEASKCL